MTADIAHGRDRSDYSLGVDDDAERARLLAQCAMHGVEAGVLLDRIGLRPGGRALDLGCGPLGVLDQLAERVGAGGHVVGLDREDRYLAIARGNWTRAGSPPSTCAWGTPRRRTCRRRRSTWCTSAWCSTGPCRCPVAAA